MAAAAVRAAGAPMAPSSFARLPAVAVAADVAAGAAAHAVADTAAAAAAAGIPAAEQAEAVERPPVERP